MTRCSRGPKDYRGIDTEGLNRIASLNAMNRSELVDCANAMWKGAYGYKVITE